MKLSGLLYENSPVSGRRIDYTVDEVVPLIDAKYRDVSAKLRRMMTWHDFVMQLLLILAPAAILTLIQVRRR